MSEESSGDVCLPEFNDQDNPNFFNHERVHIMRQEHPPNMCFLKRAAFHNTSHEKKHATLGNDDNANLRFHTDEAGTENLSVTERLLVSSHPGEPSTEPQFNPCSDCSENVNNVYSCRNGLTVSGSESGKDHSLNGATFEVTTPTDEVNDADELPFPGFSPKAFFYFDQRHWLRFVCLKMITNLYFERVSMMVILLNCVTLGMYQPCEDDVCDTTRCHVLAAFDHFIFAFFSAEMCVKMTAMGVFGKEAYLAETWNRLDCFIVAAGSMEYVVDTDNLSISAIRTIRVLRPLRAINRIPNLRILVMLLLDTLPMLGNVLLLCFLVFFIFGIIGVQLWSGVLRHRCFLEINASLIDVPFFISSQTYYKPQKHDYICSPEGEGGMRHCDNLPLYELADGTRCNGTATPFGNNTPSGGVCVNWNQYYTKCLPGAYNPYFGAVSFDNIGLAWVAIFQVISLESWVNIMYYVQDAHSFWDWMYFVALIVIGSFFMINLCLVVIATQFSETKKRETERMIQERKRCQSSSTLASNSEPAGCYTELLKLIMHMIRRAKRIMFQAYHRHIHNRRKQKIKPVTSVSLRRTKVKHKNNVSKLCKQQTIEAVPAASSTLHRQHHIQSMYQRPQRYLRHVNVITPESIMLNTDSNYLAPRASPETSDVDPSTSPRWSEILRSEQHYHAGRQSYECIQCFAVEALDTLSPSILKTSSQHSSERLFPPQFFAASRSPSAFGISNGSISDKGIMASLPDVLAAHGAKNASLAASNMLQNANWEPEKLQAVADKGMFTDNLLMGMVDEKRLSIQSSFGSDIIDPHPTQSLRDDMMDSDGKERRECQSGHVAVSSKSTYDENLERLQHVSTLDCLQELLLNFVESNFFQRTILSAILLNTLSMGVEYHNQPETLTVILEYSNIIFTILFAAEMGLKVLGYGIWGYISDGFNVFDGFIVVLSVVELTQGGASGLSVLRTFRLLRILKLVRFMPALRRQLVVMLRTMDNVATFFALLLLFIFIFSILGMNLFGCKFCKKMSSGERKCDRKNFDSLLWAIVTVFQVLTQEDWNTVLFNGMHFTSPWASLYFIALMTFGNYVLFNLLVAILVEGFSTEDEDKKKERLLEQEQYEKIEKEKEKFRLADNNNSENDETIANKETIDFKNNKEKERKMLSLPFHKATFDCTDCSKDIRLQHSIQQKSPTTDCKKLTLTKNDVDVNGHLPVITHTAATPLDTPLATPRGSPHDNVIKAFKKLSVSPTPSSNASISTDADATHYAVSENTPRLHGGCIRSSRRMKNRQMSDSDKRSLVDGNLSDSQDDEEFFQLFNQNSPSPFFCCNGVSNTMDSISSSEGNGSFPLNNQRKITPQNSIKNQDRNCFQQQYQQQRALTPKTSINSNHSQHCSRNNSFSSGRSVVQSFELSRQNSFISRRTLNSYGSAKSHDESGGYQHSKRTNHPNCKCPLDREEAEMYDDEEDPDAIDETEWNCSWCPEPKGCFLWRHEYSLYILNYENCLRQMCHRLISRYWFDNAVLFFISLNCVTLAMERPSIPTRSAERTFLTFANNVFTVVFGLEMVVKVIAKGLVVGKHAYMKSGWNVMDGFLVVISSIDTIISITASSSPRIFGILRVFRLLRALRPLRVISRAPGLKLVVQTLLSSLRPIGNIVLICCTFFIIFGILGVQLFKGTFYYCRARDGMPHETVVNRTQCDREARSAWVNHKYNFDNLGMALMALFVLASKDGWVQIMYTGLDAVGVDQQPRENHNEWRLFYFISFLLLVGFFVLNMFVGVVVENFHKCREIQENEERAMRATKREKKLESKRKKLQEQPYWARYSRPRLILHTVTTSKYFDLAISGVIGLNVITMAMEFYLMPQELQFALKIFNYFFTSVFILEAAIKIISLSFLRYIVDRWNQLDILIVILSIVGIILDEMRTNVIPINPTIIRVMRVLRIARVLKLLKMAKGIRALLDTIIQALPQVGNLGLLFFLLFFIFAALGVELFGRLECSLDHPCVGLGEHAHFRNFGMAFLTLFRIATGDNWNGIMKDTLREDCDRGDDCFTNCCVSQIIAPVYFVVFVLMAQFVLVNVVVAVLMKHLEETYKYKELDDEVEEELRLELIALRGDTREEIELKEAQCETVRTRKSCKDFESNDKPSTTSLKKYDAAPTSTQKLLVLSSNEYSERRRQQSDANTELTATSQQPTPSFSVSVRPPSVQSHHSDDNGETSCQLEGSSTMDTLSTHSCGYYFCPDTLGPVSLSCASLSPCRSTFKPNLLSPVSFHKMRSSPVSPGSHVTSLPLSPVQQDPHLVHLRSESPGRKFLTKQYSIDLGMECPSSNQSNSRVTNLQFGGKHNTHQIKITTEDNIFHSHPTINHLTFNESDPGIASDKTLSTRNAKQCLLRTRSSGAKYNHYKDKYKLAKSTAKNTSRNLC